MAKLNPTSVNTIRVMTMIDANNQIHIIDTVAKAGMSTSCVSNTLSGGVCCHIDNRTGIIDGQGYTMFGERIFIHPISGVVIPGFQLPNWGGVCDFAKKLAAVVPGGRYIGWDIVILENGYEVIEGNIHPGQDFQAGTGIGRWKDIKLLI